MHEGGGLIEPQRVGVRHATTFNGFCNIHDGELFRPVEVGRPEISAQNVFLLTFRAIAYELFSKRAELKCIELQRQLDLGAPFERQAEIQTHLHYCSEGVKQGLADLERWKLLYDEAYRRDNWASFSVYAVEFDRILPVVACGAFYPEVDFSGATLQRLGHSIADFSCVAFNLTTINGHSVAAFGWLNADSGPTDAFVESFDDISDVDKAIAAIHLAFEHLENTCIRPSWWRELPAPAREFALRQFRSGLRAPDADRREDSLAIRPCRFTEALVLQKYSSRPGLSRIAP
jgi:hypothetical protein